MKKFLLSMLAATMLLSSTANAALDEQSQEEIAKMISRSETARMTDQIILVVDHTLSLWNKTPRGSWELELESYCGYGRNGFSRPTERIAGDKTTPRGAYPILYAFGLGDNPGTSMEYRRITERSYLSGEESTYNRWLESDAWVDGEHLIDYYQYKYAMNIGFNVEPTVYGRGAAIFLHCRSTDRWWTSGCVSVPEDVMLDLLRRSHDGEYIIICSTLDELNAY